jgi:GNAT superfamily N-acetyltransferase
VILRPRSHADLEACQRLALAVRATDGYPPFLPDDDYRAFLASPSALGAWVATDGDAIVGHVALHRHASSAVVALAARETGVAADRLGVVARLLVSPATRRGGTGRRLLDHATDAARERGLVPVLDVLPRFRGAVALYEGAGWVRLGEVTVVLPDGSSIQELVFVAPDGQATTA